MIYKISNNSYLIVFITIFYSLTVGGGLYGFGIDYYTAYYKENLSWGGWTDKLGFQISTFTIFGINFGVYLTSFILAISSGILISTFLKGKKIYSTVFFFLIYTMALHTWPIIMSTSNAMRQGIAMSLIFLCFSKVLNQKYLIAAIFITTSIFMHKSGIFFLYIFVIVLFLRMLNMIGINKYFLIFISVLSGVIFNIYLLTFISQLQEESRIIRGDFRYEFLLISLIFIFIFTLRSKSLISNDLNLFMYLFSFFTIPVLFLGYNWQYERLMMMMTIPYLLIFSTLFNKKYSKLLLIVSFGLLLSLTIIQGMYDSLE